MLGGGIGCHNEGVRATSAIITKRYQPIQVELGIYSSTK